MQTQKEYDAPNSFRPTINNSFMIDENDEDDFDMINFDKF